MIPPRKPTRSSGWVPCSQRQLQADLRPRQVSCEKNSDRDIHRPLSAPAYPNSRYHREIDAEYAYPGALGFHRVNPVQRRWHACPQCWKGQLCAAASAVAICISLRPRDENFRIFLRILVFKLFYPLLTYLTANAAWKPGCVE